MSSYKEHRYIGSLTGIYISLVRKSGGCFDGGSMNLEHDSNRWKGSIAFYVEDGVVNLPQIEGEFLDWVWVRESNR